MAVLVFMEKTSSNLIDVELKGNPFKKKHLPPGVIITHNHPMSDDLWKDVFPQCQPKKE